MYRRCWIATDHGEMGAVTKTARHMIGAVAQESVLEVERHRKQAEHDQAGEEASRRELKSLDSVSFLLLDDGDVDVTQSRRVRASFLPIP